MIARQLGKITGTSLSGHEFAWQTGSFISHIDDVHWPTATLAAAVVALQIALAKWAPRWPGPLIAVVVARAVVALWSMDTKGIAVIGSLRRVCQVSSADPRPE